MNRREKIFLALAIVVVVGTAGGLLFFGSLPPRDASFNVQYSASTSPFISAPMFFGSPAAPQP